ncbi:MAG: hypothetical protein KGQ60_19225, partial [Planctomycetes bacterium]|nr:hypothetical protein [Planctomycetota bacterium]
CFEKISGEKLDCEIEFFILRLDESEWLVDMSRSNLYRSNEFVIVEELRQRAQRVLCHSDSWGTRDIPTCYREACVSYPGRFVDKESDSEMNSGV